MTTSLLPPSEPATEICTVRPIRPKNEALRTREHLTTAEVEALVEAGTDGAMH
jgi:hypothetical protein